MCQIANNKRTPRTPAATPITMPNVDVEEEESSDDNLSDDIGGGHVSIGGLCDQGTGIVGYGFEGVSGDGGGR